MDMSVESKSKFAAPHRQWWRLQWVKNYRVGRLLQTNKTFLLVMEVEAFFKCNWRLDKEPTKFNDGRLKNW